jgi:hypothetical protein
LDHPLKWRWRPFVGAELVFFSLLALTHTVMARSPKYDSWTLVTDEWGGGLVGWALSVTLAKYLQPVDLVVLLALLTLGLGLTFDVTAVDVKRAATAVWGTVAGWVTRWRAGAAARDRQTTATRARAARDVRAGERAQPARPVRSPASSPSQPASRRQAPVAPQARAVAVDPRRVEGREPPRAMPASVTPTATQTSPAAAVTGTQAAPLPTQSRPAIEYTLPEIDLLEEPEGP